MKAEEFLCWSFGGLTIVMTVLMSAFAIDIYRDILSRKKDGE